MSETDLPIREAMEFDVAIVGAGPAGLSAAIRLKQLNPEFAVVVVEKGSEVGAHILSGAVIDPIGLDRLLPEWRQEETPIKTPVTDDRFYWLGPAGSVRVPNFLLPPLMSNHGAFIVSLGNVCRWLATKAEALGVEIYPGFAAAEVLYGENGEVAGVLSGAPSSCQFGSSSLSARGSNTAPDRMCAPTSEPFSTTHTEVSRPCSAASCFRRIAAARPDGPAPTITTS